MESDVLLEARPWCRYTKVFIQRMPECGADEDEADKQTERHACAPGQPGPRRLNRKKKIRIRRRQKMRIHHRELAAEAQSIGGCSADDGEKTTPCPPKFRSAFPSVRWRNSASLQIKGPRCESPVVRYAFSKYLEGIRLAIQKWRSNPCRISCKRSEKLKSGLSNDSLRWASRPRCLNADVCFAPTKIAMRFPFLRPKAQRRELLFYASSGRRQCTESAVSFKVREEFEPGVVGFAVDGRRGGEI